MEAAFLFPYTAAVDVDLILCAASTAYLVKCCKDTKKVSNKLDYYWTTMTSIILLIWREKLQGHSPSTVAFFSGRLYMMALPEASGFGLGYPCS